MVLNMRNKKNIEEHILGLEISPTLKLKYLCNQLKNEGLNIYDLGLGQSPFPVPNIVVEELRKYAKEKEYLPVQGLNQLREAVVKFHKNIDKINDVNKDLVIVGPGLKELVFILQVVFRGEIIIPSPSWVSYVPQSKIVKKPVVHIHTKFSDRWRISASQLEKVCKTKRHRAKLLILNYPGNPDGISYTEKELRDIAQVARKYNLIILSDEIYGPLNYNGSHISIAKFYPEGTILASGISKWCGAGGWRLGTLLFPKKLDWLLDAAKVVASETYSSASAPIQYAAVKAFEMEQEMQDYLAHIRRILKLLSTEIVQILQSANISVHKPKGGFYLFADFTPLQNALKNLGIKTGRDLAEKLLKDTGVAVLHGAAFSRPEKELTVRIAFVNFDGGKALEESRKIPLSEPLPKNFLDLYCGETTEAMKKVKKWVEDIK